MPYTIIEDFRRGVDRSRPIYAGEPGSLWSGINCHFTRGGDVESAKKFVAKYTLPANTFGLKATASGLTVFGSAVAPTMPSGVSYQRLQDTGTANMTRVLDSELYTGSIYAIALFDDGDIHHYYNGTRITDWDGGAGNPTVKGEIARALGRKMYAAGGAELAISGTDTATGWTEGTDTGSDQITMSNHAAGFEELTGLAIYQQKLAVFARNAVQIWTMVSDPANNTQDQVLQENGTRSPRSVRTFGALDVFYLSESGIRSLRARDSLNSAAVEDVGTPIDTLVLEWLATLSDDEIERACSIVEPKEGRYWLAAGGRVFVFTYFPKTKISAWSWYEPGFTISDLTTYQGRIYARSGNTIYLYGGDSNAVYTDDDVTVQLPFLSNQKDGHFKHYAGIDIAATGSWTVDLLVDPNNEDVIEYLGDLSGVTFPLEDTGHASQHTHVAPRAVHTGGGKASLSKLALYWTGGASEGGSR